MRRAIDRGARPGSSVERQKSAEAGRKLFY